MANDKETSSAQSSGKSMDQKTKPLPHPESDANAVQGRSHKVDILEEPPGPEKEGVPSQPLRRDGA
ncbi:MAG: hypothetical protein ACJ746_12160 [Bryobacteraceae bacterium]